MNKAIERIAVIGSGVMGHGIALVCALKGKKTALIDVAPEFLDRAKQKIAAALDSLSSEGMVSVEAPESLLNNIAYHASLEEGVEGADLVFEAIPEKLPLKATLFERLDACCPVDTIYATNTSGLPINQLAKLTAHPERFIGTHFFMPAYLVPLVEVVEAEETQKEVVLSVIEFLTKMGKAPVHVRKDIPGFIANRLQHALAREAMSLVQKGVASVEDIDTVVKTSLAIRLLSTGPLEQRDFNGLDTHLSIAEYLYQDLEDAKIPLSILSDKVQAGNLGIKTGKGFYDWTASDIPQVIANKNRRLIQALKLLADSST